MDGETRPTFDQAFSAPEPSAAASPAAEPVADQTDPTASASAATTEPPAETPAVTEQPPASTAGEPPKERWQDILNNQREKAKADALAEWRQQYGWAEQVDRAKLQELAQWYQAQASDPVGYVVQALDDLLTNQQYAPQIASHAARILAQRRGSAQPQSIEPGIPVFDEQGREVDRTYSAKQVQQLIEQAVQGALGKEVAPLKQSFQAIEQERTQRQIAADANAKAQTVLKQAEAWPGFAEHKDAIAKVYEANPSFTLEQAYLAILKDQILPTLTKAESDKVLANLQTKAAASALNPASAAPSSPKRPKNFYEAFGVER